ncbi:uncharacterized protein LOC143846925 [Tasmannia lanceolata]|uniref:uncharacterized protein LOC143846925 n=1 Tax=Tasmannia lanceolata TaxID=3420 RepID=UPI0040644BD8
MRFNKGTKVEVLNRRGVPSGSWWCAEIVSGNGHNYTVRYDISPDMTDAPIMERVPRKAIRPCPPVGSEENWVPGNIVEVYDANSWKIAEVSEVMGGHYILVRLLGSSREFRVHKSDLRLRKSWHDNQWVMIGKDSRNCEDEKCNRLSTTRHYPKSNCQMLLPDVKVDASAGDVHHPVEKDNDFQEPIRICSRGLKRSSLFCSSHVEMHVGSGQKVRAIDKEGRRQRLVPGHRSALPEKVDAVASPQTMLGEKYMHASINNRKTGFHEMDVGREKPNTDDVRCFFPRGLELNDAESSTCSVASCSSTACGPYKLPYSSMKDLSQDTDSPCDDANSSNEFKYGRKSSFPTNEDLAAEVHRLELHAYRSTMEALYASGPLSWEQEAMMTNLRLTLHISNDEHLLELRHLVSAEADLPIN